MKKILLIISIIVATINVLGQQNEIDSLENYYHYSSDEKRMEICLHLANRYRNMDPSRGLEYAYEGLHVSRQLGVQETEGAILNEIGVLFRKLGDLNKAMIYHKDALEVFREIDDQMGIAFCFSNIASVNFAMGYYEMALEYAHRSLDIKREFKDENQIAYTTRIIATIYHESGRYEEAMPYYKEAVKYYLKLENRLEEANVMLNIAILSTSIDNGYNNKQIDSLFIESQKLYELEGSKYGVGAVKFYRADWEYRNGRPTVAEQYYLDALRIADEIDARLLYIKIVNRLGDFYDDIGRDDKAYKYLKEYTHLQEEIFSEKNARDIADMEARILLEEQEAEISGLKENQKTRNIFIVLILVILVLSLILLFGASKRYRESKKLNQRLNNEIMQRKASQELLVESEKELKEHIADKNRFLSILSHDLRSPFSGMYGLIYVLNHQYDDFDDDKKHEILSKLQSSSEHINELLEDILSWASLSSGKVVYKPVEFELKKVIDEVLELNSIRLQSKEISCTVKGNCHSVLADKYMVKTILMNLFSNAMKFSDLQSTIKVSCIDLGADILLSIKDYGIGMDMDLIKMVLIPGKHTSRNGTSGEKGSGIGLLLVHELLEKHGSKLEVESSPGQGTTMSFKLKKA